MITKYSIPEMTCAHCKMAIDQAIKLLDTAAVLNFDMTAQIITLQSDISTVAVRRVLQEAGYIATPL